MWPFNGNFLLADYERVSDEYVPKPLMVVYFDNEDFRNYVIRLGLMLINHSYKVDKVDSIQQLTTHLIQPIPLRNFARFLGVEARTIPIVGSGYRKNLPVPQIYQELLNLS